jgi:NAD dependent epimerase/dehydratase family enzyme
MPQSAVGLVFGREALLSGQRVLPKKLTDAGFTLEHNSVAEALAALG